MLAAQLATEQHATATPARKSRSVEVIYADIVISANSMTIIVLGKSSQSEVGEFMISHIARDVHDNINTSQTE